MKDERTPRQIWQDWGCPGDLNEAMEVAHTLRCNEIEGNFQVGLNWRREFADWCKEQRERGKEYPLYRSVTGDTWIIDEDGDQVSVNPGDLVKQ